MPIIAALAAIAAKWKKNIFSTILKVRYFQDSHTNNNNSSFVSLVLLLSISFIEWNALCACESANKTINRHIKDKTNDGKDPAQNGCRGEKNNALSTTRRDVWKFVFFRFFTHRNIVLYLVHSRSLELHIAQLFDLCLLGTVLVGSAISYFSNTLAIWNWNKSGKIIIT